MHQNESGLEPLGHAVLVRPYKPQKKDGMIHIPEAVEQQSSMLENRAEVVAIGPECWDGEKSPRCVPGDKVIMTRMAGYQTRGPGDGKLYRMVNDRDVFCKITKENDNG